MHALMSGVNEFIPQNLLVMFDANEMEVLSLIPSPSPAMGCFQHLLCGLQTIDTKDWKDNTLYKGGYSANHPVIQNFWKVSSSSSAMGKTSQDCSAS